MGEESKPVPVLDTGAEGENDTSASPRHCGLDPPVHRDENDEASARHSGVGRNPRCKRALAQRDQRLVNLEGRAGRGTRHATLDPVSTARCARGRIRHCGLDPQSRGVDGPRHPVILHLIQYPAVGIRVMVIDLVR